MNKRIVLVGGCLAALSAIVLAHAQRIHPLRVVPEVDLVRHAGQWYEIARFPNRFQKLCVGDVTASYTLQPNGKTSVLNRCRLENGEQIEAKGVARVAGKGQPNSILKVRFAPAFRTFISLDSRRSPQIHDATCDRLVEEARAQGSDVGRLQKTRQSGF
jgi:apolipoprotein D and lipocalin family protein